MNGLIISLLVFIAVVVVLAVGIGFFFASRARTQAEHRVAAEELRSDAQGIAPAVALSALGHGETGHEKN